MEPTYKSAGHAAKRGAVRGVLCTLPFCVLPFLPVTQNVVSPESGAGAQAQAQTVAQAFTEAMDQCQPLPAGTLPGAVVIDYVGLLPRYTTAHKHVDAGFNVALGTPNPRVEGVTLCK